MRTVVLLCCVALGGCAARDNPAADIAAAEEAVGALFAAVETWDMEALRESVTPDFELVEDSAIMNMDEFIAMIEPMQANNPVMGWDLSDFNTEVSGDVAWTRYLDEGVFIQGSDTTRFRWIESAVLLRQESGGWKIDRLQSHTVSITGAMAAQAPAPAPADSLQ